MSNQRFLTTNKRMKITAFLFVFSLSCYSSTYPARKVVVRNYYYPKPGKLEEVIALRIDASKLLKEFGLSSGRVMVAEQNEDEAVVWESEYQSIQSLNSELDSFTAHQKAKFKTMILDKMKLITTKFKRTQSVVVYE